MRLRIKFSKTGPMRYISHLDIMRFFQKALKRADADVSMSEGFSPHMLMSFALPLSLGMESIGEYFDVDVNSCSSTQKLMEDLNMQMCEGCRIFSVKSIPQDKANKCMTQVAAADYSVFVCCCKGEAVNLKKKAEEFMALSEIKVLKKTKKGEQETDIKPHIYSFEYCGTGSIGSGSTCCTDIVEDETECIGGVFRMRLGAGSVNHVRCDSVMSEFFRFAGIPEDRLSVDIRRDDLLLDTGDGFAPLENIGEEI